MAFDSVKSFDLPVWMANYLRWCDRLWLVHSRSLSGKSSEDPNSLIWCPSVSESRGFMNWEVFPTFLTTNSGAHGKWILWWDPLMFKPSMCVILLWHKEFLLFLHIQLIRAFQVSCLLLYQKKVSSLLLSINPFFLSGKRTWGATGISYFWFNRQHISFIYG